MIAENGGERKFSRAIWYLHPIKDTSDRKRLKRTCNHVLHETKVQEGWGGWPEGALAIASDQSGDQLFFPRNDDRMGPEVCLFLHETQQCKVAKKDFAELLRA